MPMSERHSEGYSHPEQKKDSQGNSISHKGSISDRNTFDKSMPGVNRLGPDRKLDMIDSFADYKYRDECDISSLDLHYPHQELCKDRQSLLDAMSGGGRAGFDAPYQSRGCDMRWYTTDEVCDILGRFERVIVMGDSMMRHMFAALNVMTRKDLGYGAVSSWGFSDEDFEACFCIKQVDVKNCSMQTVGSTADVKEWDSKSFKCKNDVFAAMHILVLYPIDESMLLELAADLINLNTGKPYAFVYGHGLWNGLHTYSTLAWIEQIEQLVRDNFPHIITGPNSTWPRLFISPPASGVKKDDIWIPTQGNKPLMLFEESMREHLPPLGIDVLGTWNATIQATSYDGSHQDLRANLLKSQMMLNWLDMVSKEWPESQGVTGSIGSTNVSPRIKTDPLSGDKSQAKQPAAANKNVPVGAK